MICVKNATMDVVHLSPEWDDFTGLPIEAALGRGWLSAVLDDDRPFVEGVLAQAARHESGYAMTYRMIRRSGSPVWISDGAVPSFTPYDRRFIGLLGSLTEVPAMPGGARGGIGRFDPPPPASSTLTQATSDLAADYILMARALAERDGDPGLIEALDIALYIARRRMEGSVH